MHSSWTLDHLQARMLKPSCDKLWHGVTVLRAWPHLYTEADLVFFLGNCLHALGMVTLSLSWLSRESELKEWIRFDVTLNNWMNCKNVLADFIAIYPACIISNLDDQFQCQKRIKFLKYIIYPLLQVARWKFNFEVPLYYQWSILPHSLYTVSPAIAACCWHVGHVHWSRTGQWLRARHMSHMAHHSLHTAPSPFSPD